MPSTPSPSDIRADLERRIVADLMGPADGPDETLSIGSRRVRDRYLVGMLAPKDTVWDEPEMIGDDDNSDGGDDHGEVVRPPAKPVLTPSSIGLTFAVEPDVVELAVTASWGQYERVLERDEEGASVRVWQRHPVDVVLVVPVGDGDIGPTPTPADALVVLEGRSRMTASGCRLVTLFLRNQRPEPQRNKDSSWLFQAKLSVQDRDNGAVFVGRAEAMGSTAAHSDDPEAVEMARLDLQYRERVEFAIGHGVATSVMLADKDRRRAVRVETAIIPRFEVGPTTSPGVAAGSGLEGVVLDMRLLAECDDDTLRASLLPLVEGYESWIAAQAQRLAADNGRDLGAHQIAANIAIGEVQSIAAALRAGVVLICTNAQAGAAFRFANRAMWQQRVRSEAVALRRAEPTLSLDDALQRTDIEPLRSWRPFQLAFICLNAPSLTDPEHPERTSDALVDLLFFPTGGGKTEAYLGLVAFTFAIRRLQGVVHGYDGRDGVAVLMRYTLRALTAQQFERAAALVCACESIRSQSPTIWGSVPFRLGMWVGSGVTPNRRSDVIQAVRDARKQKSSRSSNPLQLTSCPWCGSELLLGRDVDAENLFDRTLVYCSDPLGSCEYTQTRRPNEGLPVVTVDEEIYRLLPSFIISTVDKFAQLPWKGPLAMLFGRVAKRCERHGYRSDALDRDLSELREPLASHPAAGGLPAANAAVPCSPLRPPDLIIQDELHLITGPLGTLAGLYESAIDHLATWKTESGADVRPKVVASTATVRRAGQQAWAVFYRDLRLFPPPVLDIDDTFFARQLPVTVDTPGRAYLGICAHGRRLKEVENRVYATVMAAAQAVYEEHGSSADPWMTTVGYFNAVRELAGMKRLADDELRKRLQRSGGTPGLTARFGIQVRELTSRVTSDDIRNILDDLRTPFGTEHADAKPVDLVLATNMISVGVDVPRLGLMVAVGQPKSTAEYIQATSRVGRSKAGPGLVITLYNWTRPRDLSHYETFEHFHDTFYRQVEPLSVTPFSAGARRKGLTGVLVGLLRHTAHERNPAEGVRLIDRNTPDVGAIVKLLSDRAAAIDLEGNFAGDQMRKEVQSRLDELATKQLLHAGVLTYEREGGNKGREVRLLRKAEEGPWERWTCPMSLRDTEPGVNLLIDRLDPQAHLQPAFSFAAPSPKKAKDRKVSASHDGVDETTLVGDL